MGKRIFIGGKFLIGQGSGGASKLVKGVVKLVRVAFDGAVMIVSKVAKMIPGLRNMFFEQIRKVKSVCSAFNSFKPAKWACKNAFDVGLMAMKKASDFGLKALDGF